MATSALFADYLLLSPGQTDDDTDNEAGCMFCLQDNLSSGVAGVTEGDYRMDGKMELITATTDGESKLHKM